MRYSHTLKRYHSKPHKPLAYAVTIVSFLAIGALIAVSHTNATELLTGLLSSTYRVFTAYLFTLPISIIIVLLITRNQKVEDFFVPILDVAQSFPSFAILPLILAISGTGSASIIFFLVITMVWPVIFTALSGIKSVREDLGEAAAIFQAKGIKRFIYFSLPALKPSIVTGSIVGWGEAWEAIVGAELIARRGGIGAFINHAYQNENKQIFTFSIIILMLFIFILNRLIWLPLLKKTTRYQTE